jgi:two-component system, OmpR family, response regulator MtrA
MNQGGHILIIDDEAGLRQTMARILLHAGFEVTTVATGQESLAIIQSHAFDMVFLDIRLPDMNGLDVLKVIRELLPELPILLFTAQPDLHSAVEALRRGATDYLMKPLKPETVIERTRHIINEQNKKKRRRAILQQMDELQAELDTLDGTYVPEKKPTGPLPTGSLSDRFIKCGPLHLDLHTRRVAINEHPVNLAPTSFDYLLVLARHSPNVVDYQTLVAEAQGYQSDARDAQDLTKWHIHNIRQAVEMEVNNQIHVVTVRGSGYRLVTD